MPLDKWNDFLIQDLELMRILLTEEIKDFYKDDRFDEYFDEFSKRYNYMAENGYPELGEPGY